MKIFMIFTLSQPPSFCDVNRAGQPPGKIACVFKNPESAGTVSVERCLLERKVIFSAPTLYIRSPNS